MVEEDEVEKCVAAVIALAALLAIVASRNRGGASASPSLGLHVSRIKGRKRNMPPIERPLLELVDVEFSVLSINPLDADNRRPVDRSYSWSVSDQVADDAAAGGDVVTLEDTQAGDVPDGTPVQFARRVISGVPGTAKIHVTTTLSNGDVLEEIMPVKIKAGEPSALNLSAGPPRPETP